MLDTDDRLQPALALAYRYLNPRDRTVAEMRRHLQAKGIEDSDADQAIATLLAQSYLDDVRFARLFTQDKRELQQWGSDRIRRDLRARGIKPELIERMLGGASSDAGPGVAHPTAGDPSPDAERDRALGLLRRRFPDPPRDRRERNRALGLLLRKGYDGELALDALAMYARGG